MAGSGFEHTRLENKVLHGRSMLLAAVLVARNHAVNLFFFSVASAFIHGTRTALFRLLTNVVSGIGFTVAWQYLQEILL
jgi:hypothetical protein